MRTRPDDLSDQAIVHALAAGWGIDAVTLDHQPLGFGSHHWKATDATARAWFVTVDDLFAKLRHSADTSDAAFGRLEGAFRAVQALHDDAGLHFTVPPIPDRRGQVIQRVGDRYSIVVHPFLVGLSAGEHGEYDTATDRAAVVELLVELHAATEVATPHAELDDLALPHREDLLVALSETSRRWDRGPYGESARTLLVEHETALRALLAAYAELAHEVGLRPERAVITHGEPHAGNVLLVDGGHRLIDWDTARIAAPERDLCVLDPGDGSILEAYRSATGVTARPEALDLYRLWYDLDEIGGYLTGFRRPHDDDADAAESWANLQHFLQPAARWPALVS